MCVVETYHFLDRWAERVGDYRPRVRKTVLRAIQRGEQRRHRRRELGVLVPVKYRGEIFCIIGVEDEKIEVEDEKEEDVKFVLKTVLTEEQARAHGWVR